MLLVHKRTKISNIHYTRMLGAKRYILITVHVLARYKACWKSPATNIIVLIIHVLSSFIAVEVLKYMYADTLHVHVHVHVVVVTSSKLKLDWVGASVYEHIHMYMYSYTRRQ